MPLFEPKFVREMGWGATVPNTATATDAAATLTYYGIDDGVSCLGIYGVAWSYSGGTPAGGNLQIADGDTVVFDIDLPAEATNDDLIFPSPFVCLSGNNLVITLASGGSDIVGKVNGIGPFVTQTYPGGPPLSVDFDFSDPANSGLLFAGVL